MTADPDLQCPDVVLIAGPTASGKSALAVDIATRLDGVVIKADSMQVYDALQILTARPGRDEMQGITHLLYGHVPASRAYSAGAWLADASAAIQAARVRGKTPVLVGGTGLYFKALEEGLSPMPAVDPAIRKAWREVAAATPQTLHAELSRRDPQAAETLEPGDTQRLVRALETHESTGRSILDWQRQG
ncbi:MAG: tRNA (adenosine(37)-N6)-dimethylallyltransferase MiaA, partial [Pseudomonadota bacterium]|nr:tRNA (adenosine(37)-N6)-dimethylallyltransferase MiaA [Pseudomonadota bacterium]